VIRRQAHRVLRDRLYRRTTALPQVEIEKSAIVLAPHPDDETLGCGGLIALKRAAGADVTIVFLTDGAGSHTAVSRADLAATRRLEATTATSILGVTPDHLRFLEIPDGELEHSVEHAVDLLELILRDSAAKQVILPHPMEPPPDHRVVHRIADQAARRLGRKITGLAFPVWLWDQWPWTNPLAPPRVRHSDREIVKIAARDRLGLAMTKYMTHSVDVTATLELKRSALAAHRSQMDRPADDPTWITLSDICDGEWIDWMLQPTEFYGTIQIGDGGASAGSPAA